MSLNCWSQLQGHIIEVLKYSGRSIRQLGEYNQCLAADKMDYYMISFGQLAAGGYMGVCLPETCSASQVKSSLNTILTCQHIPISVIDVTNHLDEFQPPYSWVFYLTMLLIIFLTTMTILTTIKSQLSKHPIMSAFSLQNSLKAYTYKHNPLNILNGVRSLCMLWVIFGHEYLDNITTSAYMGTINKQMSSLYFLFVEAGYFSVDTFFFIGGFLVAYSILKDELSVKKYPLAFLNRWLRIVPAYLVAIFLFYSVYVHVGSGPRWGNIPAAVQTCASIWRPLLFVDNLVDNGKDQCMVWGWYLQNDMQLFLYSILMLAIYKWNSFTGYVAIMWSMLGSFWWTMWVTYENEYLNVTHLMDFTRMGNYNLDVYVKPWSRSPPYLYGLILGMLYVEYMVAERRGEKHVLVGLKERMKDWRWRWVVEGIGLGLGLWVVLIPRSAQGDEHYWPQLAHSLYLTYARTLFVVGVSFIVAPALLGLPSFFSFILDTKLFHFIAKASYCTYLIHVMLIILWVGSQGTNFYYQPFSTYSLFASHSAVSIFLGFLMSVIVQIPCSRLQRQLMGYLLNPAKSSHGKKQVEPLVQAQRMGKQ